MPHIIVKLWPGKSEQQKQRLADAITQQVTAILGYTDDAVSVGFDEVASSVWRDQVYRPGGFEKPSGFEGSSVIPSLLR
ncbi:4-oxalocrotonate tautomerase [Gluconobacter sp. DsW_056]|uniref:4-oxalocrotonate tautomerase-like domain-containing protein n=1 Tax=Gluconobacter kondonii TaxID=941463 RepID=A0ABQ5WSK3_9PROT|nr:MULTISPECIES: tautomerase family protein [Gluconobacter]MCP1237497.1 tautomerase family protein [Gluconobacter kondonii]OUI80100.1 4-oxalocrotonate tautomerase [Gluconobacter sp. DsW_056]GBR38452.1 4-oxalocrotonate tautomerase [Gluconobacter kondonii NBRC 3266]GLQ66521.1 hypothetical protein GCM10007870_21050 [Gluconobacter kondonii]